MSFLCRNQKIIYGFHRNYSVITSGNTASYFLESIMLISLVALYIDSNKNGINRVTFPSMGPMEGNISFLCLNPEI